MSLNMLNHNKSLPGFTLIELLVVIVIIGVLAGILLPNMLGMRMRARDSQLKSELRQLKNALEIYYANYQSYPASSGVTMLGCGGAVANACNPGGEFIREDEVYMQTLPEKFNYNQTSSGQGFLLWAGLENPSDQDAGNSQAKCGVSAADSDYYECMM